MPKVQAEADVLVEYESYWKPYYRKRILPMIIMEDIKAWQ